MAVMEVIGPRWRMIACAVEEMCFSLASFFSRILVLRARLPASTVTHGGAGGAYAVSLTVCTRYITKQTKTESSTQNPTKPLK